MFKRRQSPHPNISQRKLKNFEKTFLSECNFKISNKKYQCICYTFQQYYVKFLNCLLQHNMDHIPSQSISKSVLIVTPLFLIVLAVLHSSSELSYLFILKFINNVAGSADITFLPTVQSQMQHEEFNRVNNLKAYHINQEVYPFEGIGTPLIEIEALEKWAKKQPIIKGISPRWMIPARIGTTDIILLILNITKQTDIGLINQNTISQLDQQQITMERTLMNKLGLSVGDVVSINLQPKNMLNGLKLFQKFQNMGSDEQYKSQIEEMLSIKSLASMLNSKIKQYTSSSLNQTDLQELLDLIEASEVNVGFSLKQDFYSNGIYASAINNVVMMEYEGFNNLLIKWVTRTFQNIINLPDIDIDISKYIPPQYQKFIPRNQFEIQASAAIAKQKLKQVFEKWTLLAVCRLNNRQMVYNPYKGPIYLQFVNTLESVPSNLEPIVVYPFFEQSLAIKFFFDSVIQIFEFVTCIIYFYTMALIVKQVYEQKQVEVGIWRTLGAGGLPLKKKQSTYYEVEMQDKGVVMSRGPGIKYRSQFESSMSFRQKIKFLFRLANKVGFAVYWLISTTISILLYCFFKFILYVAICSKLGFSTVLQPVGVVFIIFFIILTFISILVYTHIKRIYSNSLSETIKPVKRTFDVVKVRIIHVATFGVTLQVLLIAIMLVYYGVVSYYWIPFAVLDGQEDLQVLLFNTIFLFMIFGAIILLSILQSRLQIGIFKLIFRFNAQMKTMKLAILKNIKAKQYKNIKVAIIISIIFAFVLFFTAGIKIQIQIIQSFIERALGSNLVFENYEKNTFKNQPINQFLDNVPGIQYSWLSKSLSRDNVSIVLMSHISGQEIEPQFQVLTPTYLNSTFYQYYYPEDYLPEYKDYWKLPNFIYDGFNSIYTGEYGEQSVGKYDPNNTIKDLDPYGIGVNRQMKTGLFPILKNEQMAPEEQVINLVVSTDLRKQLGVRVGDFYKMKVQNDQEDLSYYLRARITHSFKAGPGFDMIGSKAFISQQQADYIYRILKINETKSSENQKLFIKGSVENLKGLGTSIIAMSPEHTQMFEIQFVSQSFSLLQKYLNLYVILITCIMSVLVTIFIFLYTLGKCREEAQMYKMLRAIGLSARNIRIMVFCEIIIRLIVALLDGILLGIVFSLGFSMQIQQFLMIKTPLIDITIVSVIGVVLIIIFSITIIRATKYISQKSVAQTNKI